MYIIYLLLIVVYLFIAIYLLFFIYRLNIFLLLISNLDRISKINFPLNLLLMRPKNHK